MPKPKKPMKPKTGSKSSSKTPRSFKSYSDSNLMHHQIRIGKGKKPIVVSKFRTMSIGAHGEYDSIHGSKAQQTREQFNKKYTTKLGKFLRETKLDESPQLMNVLKGEINLVGIRPLARQDYNRLPADVKAMYDKHGPGWFTVYSALPPKQRSRENAMKIYRLYYAEKEKSVVKTNTKYLSKIFSNYFISLVKPKKKN